MTLFLGYQVEKKVLFLCHLAPAGGRNNNFQILISYDSLKLLGGGKKSSELESAVLQQVI